VKIGDNKYAIRTANSGRNNRMGEKAGVWGVGKNLTSLRSMLHEHASSVVDTSWHATSPNGLGLDLIGCVVVPKHYTNDFVRHFPKINRGCHKIHPPHKMSEDLLG
jgi:hypothetical protein